MVLLVCFYLCQCCIQCSILAFYLRLGLAEHGGRQMKWIIYSLMAACIINSIGGAVLDMTFNVLILSLGFQRRKYAMPLYITNGSLHLFLDLTIWFIPLRAMYSIMHNLSTRKKILLAAALVVGMMSCCSSILRLAFWKIATGLRGDLTYNGPILILLYVIEITLAMGCVSVATYRPLVVQMTKGFNRMRGKPTSTNKSRTSGYVYENSQKNAQGRGYGSRTTGSRTTGNKGGFEENTTLTAVDLELAEWKDNAVNVKESQVTQQACSCSIRDGDIEHGSMVSHASSCPRCSDPAFGTQLQVPTPAAATSHGTTDHSSSLHGRPNLGAANITNTYLGLHSQPSHQALHSSESTVNLTATTNADINSTTKRS